MPTRRQPAETVELGGVGSVNCDWQGTCTIPAATDLTSQLTEATTVLQQDTTKLEAAKQAKLATATLDVGRLEIHVLHGPVGNGCISFGTYFEHHECEQRCLQPGDQM